jgi:hypothetical protein
MNFTEFLHIVMVIGKYTDIFRGNFFWLRGGGRVGVYVGGCSHGGRDIAIRGVPDFPALFKKTIRN